MKEKSRVVRVDLAKTVSEETLAKLYYKCRKRNLPFPEGVVFLLEEVSEPRGGKVRGQRSRKAAVRTEKVSEPRGGKVQKSVRKAAKGGR